MSRKVRQLLIFLAVLVVVGGGVALLVLLPQDGGEPASSDASSGNSSSEAISLIARSEEEIRSIAFKNEKGEVELYVDEEAASSAEETTSSSTAATVMYTVRGYEGVTILNSVARSAATLGYQLTAERDLGETSDLAPYGLDYPAASYTVVYTDGKTVTVTIGDAVPTNTARNYVMISGDKHVYIANVAEALSITGENMISTYILDLMVTNENGEQTLPTFDRIQISGRDHETPTEIYPKDEDTPQSSPLAFYTYYMKEPAVAGVTSKLTENYLTPLASLTATGVAAVNPDEATLAEYGLDDPVVLRFWIDGVKTTLLVGKVESATAYVMKEGGRVIYKVAPENVALATVSAFDLRDTLLFLSDITTIQTLTITDDAGKEYVLSLERTEKVSSSSAAASSGEPTIQYDYKCFYNDQELTYYKKFYQSFLAAYREEEPDDSVQPGKLLYSMKIDYYSEFEQEPYLIQVYEYSDRRVLYCINGEKISLVNSQWAEKLLSDLTKLINDEEITVL